METLDSPLEAQAWARFAAAAVARGAAWADAAFIADKLTAALVDRMSLDCRASIRRWPAREAA